MSRDATLELLKAVRSALVADATIAGYVADRVVTDWGNVLAAPYIRLFSRVVGPWEDDCGEGSDYRLSIHVFAQEGAPIISSRIAARTREVLQDAALMLDTGDLRELNYLSTTPLQDPDDPTLRMAVVAFQAVTTAS